MKYIHQMFVACIIVRIMKENNVKRFFKSVKDAAKVKRDSPMKIEYLT